MTYENESFTQADPGKRLGSTFERKIMSSTIKRIALVAVAALGLGSVTAISANATVLAYQIDVGTGGAGGFGAALSVLVERSGWTSNAAVQTYVRALGSNIGATQAVDASVTNVYDKGFKLARV